MPGPAYDPVRNPGAHKAAPKPVVTPWVSLPKLTNVPLADIPPQPIHAFNGLWHALGSNLPFYINQSRASRRSLRALGKTHG
jgi:hypothetical protein